MKLIRKSNDPFGDDIQMTEANKIYSLSVMQIKVIQIILNSGCKGMIRKPKAACFKSLNNSNPTKKYFPVKFETMSQNPRYNVS